MATNTTNLPTEVSARIYDVMERKQINQSKLAQTSGVSKRTIVRVLKGDHCTVATIQQLASGLGCRVEFLLRSDDDSS